MVKDFKKDSWELFNCEAKTKKLYIWGTGHRAKEIIENYKKFASSWNLVGFIDNDSRKKEYFGYSVISPSKLSEEKNAYIILISPDKPGAIAKQIENMGISDYYSYFWLNTERREACYQEDIDLEKICQIKTFLSDEDSKIILDKIVEKRKIGFLDYTDIKEEGDEYFDHEFFKYSMDEVFIDGGGFDGDTIEEFVTYTKNCYKCIYSFEPDKKTGEILQSKLYRYGDRIKFYPYGLYSQSQKLPFYNDNEVYSSHIVDHCVATSSIPCVRLDDIVLDEKVTFVKMDIEGAEVEALYGAKNTILKNKPKLAICIYHKPTDLWEIPVLLHSWIPDYKFYIRHYGARYYGTILFATI